ncbi:MAG TPA: CPXCG motif-containing cysteine-rich protein [Gemmatimonadales bacterium]|nr:CPXCG motif-containing cysteine-rich protein [Gemmatimonadales bacterium]
MIGAPDPLDDDFPLGDGTADTEAEVSCPYCGAESTIALDPGSGAEQEYVEDCQVCCRPWRVRVTYAPDGGAEVTAEPDDEADLEE